MFDNNALDKTYLFYFLYFFFLFYIWCQLQVEGTSISISDDVKRMQNFLQDMRLNFSWARFQIYIFFFFGLGEVEKEGFKIFQLVCQKVLVRSFSSLPTPFLFCSHFLVEKSDFFLPGDLYFVFFLSDLFNFFPPQTMLLLTHLPLFPHFFIFIFYLFLRKLMLSFLKKIFFLVVNFGKKFDTEPSLTAFVLFFLLIFILIGLFSSLRLPPPPSFFTLRFHYFCFYLFFFFFISIFNISRWSQIFETFQLRMQLTPHPTLLLACVDRYTRIAEQIYIQNYIVKFATYCWTGEIDVLNVFRFSQKRFKEIDDDKSQAKKNKNQPL